MSKLTKKQEAFCREYVVDFNGTQAAIRAGYSEKTAKVSASENLTKPNIQNFINELQGEQAKRLEITADELTRFFRMMKDDEDQKGSDRIKAAENLAKRFGYYEEHNKQKTNLTIKDNLSELTEDQLNARIKQLESRIS